MIPVQKFVYWSLQPWISLILHRTTRARVIMRYKNQVLLVQNRLSGGVWDLPGGGVRRGETVAHAATREIYEELAITLQPSDLKQSSAATIKRGPFWFKAVFFEVQITTKLTFSLQKYELINAQWVSSKDLSKYRLAQGVETALQRCFRHP